jgi:hypothetical protein
MAGLLSGCLGHFQPATAGFEGITQPVMLGSVDRIGGGAPLSFTKKGQFEGESKAIYSRSTSTSGNIETTTTRDMTDNLQIALDAYAALQASGPDSEIRVTTLRPWSKGFMVIMKSTVLVAGDVVTVGGAK